MDRIFIVDLEVMSLIGVYPEERESPQPLLINVAYYSVISPEGCAAILWKDRAYSDQAAEALKITGKDRETAGRKGSG